MEHWLTILGIIVAMVLASMLALTLAPAALIKRRMKRELQRRSRGRLALTYDDGPGPHLAKPLLELLAGHHARATFFLVGFRAERHPDSVDQIANEPSRHELGNHTHWHRHSWRTLPWLAVRDLHQGYQTMSRWMPGHASFRPPFGKLTTWTYLAARARQAPLCFWTHDGGDTWPTLPDPKTIADQVARDGGGVVLLHSHDRGEDRERYVLEVTECLLQTARQHNWRVCTMSEILHAGDDASNPAVCSSNDLEGGR